MDQADLGVGTGGVWTADDARRTGLTRDQVRARVRSGRWQVVCRGVYLDAGVLPGLEQRAWAAVLAAGGPDRAVATGRTAARLHGLPLVDDRDPATGRRDEVHDDVATRHHLEGSATLHPSRAAYGPQELGALRGCPVPSPARTLWDLRLVARPDALVCAVDAALHRSLVTEIQLDEVVRPGARGVEAFRTALARADGRAESPLETLTRLLLRPTLPDLEPQLEVHDARGVLLARVDLGVRALRLGIEADGATHRGELSLARDRARERRTGWTFERVTWSEVRRQPDRVLARVLATRRRLGAAA